MRLKKEKTGLSSHIYKKTQPEGSQEKGIRFVNLFCVYYFQSCTLIHTQC